MKKCYKFAAFYTILALVGGVFYREFTKLNGFHGTTTLGFVHTHAFMLGMMFFLLLILFEKQFHLTQHKKFKRFLYIYNFGLIVTIAMLITRGIPQVLTMNLSSAFNASISGIAGIGHIALGIGILYFFLMVKDCIKDSEQ